MNKDLMIIKKEYGEKMMYFCRDTFPTFLEKEGLLSRLLLENFESNKYLYEDLDIYAKTGDFKDYIYLLEKEGLYKPKEEEMPKVIKTPDVLLDEAGYILYECKTEEDIQKFTKYFKNDEKLCTFNGGRLGRCHVFFAIKKNVDEIKRENFITPERQDEYGTSVISIQFTKDQSHTLSIKNRYNHKVSNPDATFSNNLDNIKLLLTASFAHHYNLKQEYANRFELEGYVRANDNKYYRYNYEIDNVYYCPNNIIIDNFEVKRYSKDNYLVISNYILDLKKKVIYGLKRNEKDAFTKTINDEIIKNIEIINVEKNKQITFSFEEKEEKIILVIDKNNDIIEIEDNNTIKVEKGYLLYTRNIKKIIMPKLEEVSFAFLSNNLELENVELPSLKEVDYNFMRSNIKLKKLSAPNLQKVGSSFLYSNNDLEQLYLPNIKSVERKFLSKNIKINNIYMPKLEEVSNSFLTSNLELENVELPNLKEVGSYFMCENMKLKKLSAPNLEKVGCNFLDSNNDLEQLYLPNIKSVGKEFLPKNIKINNIYMPKLEVVSFEFLTSNLELENVELPNLKEVGNHFMFKNIKLKKLSTPNLEKVGSNFLFSNSGLEQLYLPNIESLGSDFLFVNKKISSIYMPKLSVVGRAFLIENQELDIIDLPSLKKVGIGFISENMKINKINFPNLDEVEAGFLKSSQVSLDNPTTKR